VEDMKEFKETLPCGVELVVRKFNGQTSIRITEPATAPMAFMIHMIHDIHGERVLTIFSNEENEEAILRAVNAVYPRRQPDWLDKIISWFNRGKL
jgi:hypothetical protein